MNFKDKTNKKKIYSKTKNKRKTPYSKSYINSRLRRCVERQILDDSKVKVGNIMEKSYQYIENGYMGISDQYTDGGMQR